MSLFFSCLLKLFSFPRIVADWTVLQATSYHSWCYPCQKTVAMQLHYGENSTLVTTTHTHPFNGPFSGTTQVSRYQKGKTNLDFTEARDGEWQWHQLGSMQVCTSLQTDNHASIPPLSFLQAGCPSCRPTNSVKALKASLVTTTSVQNVLVF